MSTPSTPRELHEVAGALRELLAAIGGDVPYVYVAALAPQIRRARAALERFDTAALYSERPSPFDEPRGG